MHKIVKRWLIIGTVEAVGVAVLTFTAPQIINGGLPMLGFAMFGGAIALGCGSTSYVGFRLTMAIRAKHQLIKHYPQYSDIPLTSFLDISSSQVDNALVLLDNLGEQQELIDSANIIAFIQETSDYEE
jgi:hypothetical protein